MPEFANCESWGVSLGGALHFVVNVEDSPLRFGEEFHRGNTMAVVQKLKVKFERRMMSKVTFLSVVMLGLCVVVGCGDGAAPAGGGGDTGHESHGMEGGSGTGGGHDMGLEAAAGEVMDNAKEAAGEAVEDVKEAGKEAVEDVKEATSEAVEGVKEGTKEAVKKAADAAKDAVGAE